jgi:hypothetical protein
MDKPIWTAPEHLPAPLGTNNAGHPGIKRRSDLLTAATRNTGHENNKFATPGVVYALAPTHVKRLLLWALSMNAKLVS